MDEFEFNRRYSKVFGENGQIKECSFESRINLIMYCDSNNEGNRKSGDLITGEIDINVVEEIRNSIGT